MRRVPLIHIDIMSRVYRTCHMGSLTSGYRYTIHRPPDGQWGTQEPNGSWNGMIGQIVRKVGSAR